MADASVTVDSSAVMAMFDEMDERRRKLVFRAALNASSGILIRETRVQLRSVVKRTKTKNKWNGRTLENGMRRYYFRDNKGVTVAIGGKDRMIDFRLKFFEAGTKNRYTKGHKVTGRKWLSGKRRVKVRSGKGGYRGRLLEGHFFRAARQKTEGRIFGEMEQRLTSFIVKINNKYANK